MDIKYLTTPHRPSGICWVRIMSYARSKPTTSIFMTLTVVLSVGAVNVSSSRNFPQCAVGFCRSFLTGATFSSRPLPSSITVSTDRAGVYVVSSTITGSVCSVQDVFSVVAMVASTVATIAVLRVDNSRQCFSFKRLRALSLCYHVWMCNLLYCTINVVSRL